MRKTRPAPTEFGKEIALILQENRIRKGISIKELADKVGLSYNQVYRYLRGKSSPNVEELLCLAEVLGTTIEQVVGEARYTVEWRAKQDKTGRQTTKPLHLEITRRINSSTYRHLYTDHDE